MSLLDSGKKTGEWIEACNPICGDKFKIYTENPIHFHGHGCALSKASGSLMIRAMDVAYDKEALLRDFILAVEIGEQNIRLDSSLNSLIVLKNHEGREDCILLIWKTMLDYLKVKR